MPKYVVKGIDIRLGGEIYHPGDPIEMTAKEAKGLSDYLEEAPAEPQGGKDK
ncbi:hypothetical protein [Geobacter sp.]|uniref:hypothetical protein n=1 Tax=Geobacter sp. TaxID=46610 RepID=UPI002603B6D4|nr:hypothetical protein [Geobacter sp.]